MTTTTAAPLQSPIQAAALALIGALACIAAFLPPLNERFAGSPLWVVALALGIAAGVLLHLAFVGILAQRLGRPAWLWVLLALVTFPLGSIVGLVLLHWHTGERPAAGS